MNIVKSCCHFDVVLIDIIININWHSSCLSPVYFSFITCLLPFCIQQPVRESVGVEKTRLHSLLSWTSAPTHTPATRSLVSGLSIYINRLHWIPGRLCCSYVCTPYSTYYGLFCHPVICSLSFLPVCFTRSCLSGGLTDLIISCCN